MKVEALARVADSLAGRRLWPGLLTARRTAVEARGREGGLGGSQEVVGRGRHVVRAGG